MTTTNHGRALISLCSIATLAVGAASCSSLRDHPLAAVQPDPKATPYVASFSKGDLDAVTTVGVADSVVNLLPNRKYQLPSGYSVANSQAVVVGRPVDVQPGEAQVWPAGQGDGDKANVVDFGDPDAMARTWTVTVAVERPVAGPDASTLLPAATVKGDVRVTLWSAGGPIDVDRYRAGLLGIGRSVWFLTAYADGPKDSFGVAWFGGAVARLADDGSLDFELLPAGVRRAMEAPNTDLDDLLQEAQVPDQVVKEGAR